MYFPDCLLYGIITSYFELLDLELISIALGLNKTWLSFIFIVCCIQFIMHLSI